MRIVFVVQNKRAGHFKKRNDVNVFGPHIIVSNVIEKTQPRVRSPIVIMFDKRVVAETNSGRFDPNVLFGTQFRHDVGNMVLVAFESVMRIPSRMLACVEEDDVVAFVAAQIF